MAYETESRRPTFAEFTYTFVPFALLITAGNLAAEASPNPTLGRVVYSMWIAMALAAPALVLFGLYDLRRAPAAAYNYWRLFWTFAYLAYLAHFYYSVGMFFGWDVHAIADRQTWPVAITNFVVTGVWGLEVLAAWTGRHYGAGFHVFQWFSHLLVLGAIIVAAIVFKSGFVSALGWALVGSFGLALLTRLLFGELSAWRERAAGAA
ncbi:MAG TPA: hypothetical protein VKD72_20590 [Gemmataceae bacterium]|nr:hypothetical protein [Gemmataceae bacterium]